MLRSVAEVSVLTGLSKVSIYNKIKLKEIEKYVVKNKGITYISDEGINLIFKGLNFNDDRLNGLTDGLNIDREDVDISIKNTDFKEFKLELKEFNKDYLNSLNHDLENITLFLERKVDCINEEKDGLNKSSTTNNWTKKEYTFLGECTELIRLLEKNINNLCFSFEFITITMIQSR